MPDKRNIRVLVCGGRDYGEVPRGCPDEPNHEARRKAAHQRFMLRATLDTLNVDHGISAIIHGACSSGADDFAGNWARRRLIEETRFPADWKSHGKPAGPIRNQQMIDEGKPDLVVAFPGGRGTADMVAKANRAGVEVIEIDA